MKSIAYIPASNQAANASQMTVQSVRSPGATDIIVNTVTGASAKFYASMGAPHTFTDPVTGETITIISEATAVDFAGHLDSGKVVIDAIAPGYVDTRGSLVGDIVVIRPNTEWANNIFNILSQSLQDDGKLKESAFDYDPNVSDVVKSGGIWTYISGLNASMSALSGYITGRLNTVAAIASRTFTASKDTYVDILRNTTTGAFSVVYTEVANNATAPALAANSMRIAKFITNATIVTTVVQSGNSDGIGNIIRPAGSLSVAQLKNPIKLSVYRAGTHTWANIGAPNPYGADTKEYDTGNNWDTTNFRFTAPVTGFYDVSFWVQLNSQAGNYGVYPRLEVNGVAVREYGQTQAASTNGGAGFNDFSIPLKVGDQVRVVMGVSSGGASSVAGGYFSYLKIRMSSAD